MRLWWRRWLFLVLGGALFTPYAILVMVVVPLAVPSLARADSAIFTALCLVVLVAALAATSWLPVVRTLEAPVVPALLGGPAAEVEVVPAFSTADRARGGLWFSLHVLAGALVSTVTVAGVPLALGLVVGTVVGDPVIPLGLDPIPVDRVWAVPLALAMLGTVVLLTAGFGAGLARLAPRLLGPGTAARLADLERRTAELTERSRLARELHDSVGHALTVTTLQASAARTVLRSDPDFAEQALRAIEETGRAAAADLDGFLGLLREDAASRAPQPTLAELDALIVSHRDAGMEVELDVAGDLGALPAVVSREAYRIVQEGLTNVHRHAASAGTTVELDASGDRFSVRLRNDPPAARVPHRRGGGRGLEGIRERVRLLGGSLEAGPVHGGWLLQAEIPVGGGR